MINDEADEAVKKIWFTKKYYYYCLSCLHSFAIDKKFELHKNVCENKDFGNVIMPSEYTKLLKFNQCKKFGKAPFIIYADLADQALKRFINKKSKQTYSIRYSNVDNIFM